MFKTDNSMREYTFIFFSSKSDQKQEKTVMAGDVMEAKQIFLAQLRLDGHEEIQIYSTIMPDKRVIY